MNLEGRDAFFKARVNAVLKQDVEEILDDLGLNMSDAINNRWNWMLPVSSLRNTAGLCCGGLVHFPSRISCIFKQTCCIT